MTCKKHPRYLAKREPTTNCRACWRVFVQQEAARQLAAAHKAAAGKMVVIDTQAQNLENLSEKISAYSPMTALQLLDALDARLVIGDEEARRLWLVLTGLRSEDNTSSSESKYDVTTWIRGLVFPRTAKSETTQFWYASMDVGDPREVISRLEARIVSQHGHFWNHAKAALDNVVRIRGLRKVDSGY